MFTRYDGYEHLGWPVSPYTAKTRAYFRFKGIKFRDREPSLPELHFRVKRAVGRFVMPTVKTPDGRWLQDTSEIIDEMEKRFSHPTVIPPGNAQRVASLLLELHGDEWLVMPALHYRWNVQKNITFARREFARYGFPGVPLGLSAALAKPVAKRMAAYLPLLGIKPETQPGIESFSQDLIAHLETHFTAHHFLLGARPCVGDFAMMGPLWAHLYRDPGSRELFDHAPHVRAWFERLLRPQGDYGEFLANDEVPTTLDPVFPTLFAEQFPYLRALLDAIETYCAKNPEAKRVPRALGNTSFCIGGAAGERRLLTFSQWMLQRPLGAYQSLSLEERAAVDSWLVRVGGQEAMQWEVKHPQEHVNFALRLAR